MRQSRSGYRRYGLAYLFITPWLLGILFFYAYPIISSLYFSFTQYDVLQPPLWVGLANYQQLPQDEYFQQALVNTLIFVAVAVPGGLIVGLLQALLLNVKLRGQRFFRGLFLVPGALPVAASAAVWVFILDPSQGLANSLLSTFGLPTQQWIVDPAMVKWAFVSITIWGGIGMLIFLASLQDVPVEMYQAAEVDGASSLTTLLHITLPYITPALLFNLLTGLINAFQYFALPMLMTQGGPLGGSTFFGQYLYDSAFQFFKMGYASAQAWVLFLLCGSVVFVLFRSSARWVYYEAE